MIRPQEGPQTRFLSTKADIALGGGSAGGGKTFSLLLEAARYIGNPEYGAVIFRREMKMITSEGGLRDTAMTLYPHLGAQYRSQPSPHFIFPSGARVTFAHLNQESECLNWQGSQIAFIGFDELTHFCITPDHEVLTKDGWKLITDVTKDDYALSLGFNSESCFLPVLNVWSFDYEGEMVSWETRGISTVVTPNHKMVVTSHENRKKWKFIEARNIEKKTTYSVYRAGSEIIQNSDDYFYFDEQVGRGLGANQNSAKKIPMKDWAEFMGWFFSEGCAVDMDSYSPFISIRQTKECNSLFDLMNRLPFRVKSDGDGGYRIFSRQLVSLLKPFGNCHEKRIPRYLFNQSSEVMSIFLDAFEKGDGHLPKGKEKGISFGLANEGLIDDLQEMYTLIGRVSVKSKRVTTYIGEKSFHHWRLYVSKKARQITQLRASGTRVNFEGKVWCLSIPKTHNFFVRRNGICYFTGNTQFQAFYMMSRLRSTSGVRPYMRWTTNPDSDSWVAEFIEWYIDQDTGFPIPERSGVLRYFARKTSNKESGNIVWGNSREETAFLAGCNPEDCKSFTFVPSKITDNPFLLKKDPGYLANLKGLPKVEKARLLDGNWKIRAEAGMYFARDEAVIIDWLPTDVVKWVRSWDLAASEESESRNPDWTVGMLVGRRASGTVVIGDVIRVRRKANAVRNLVLATAAKDGKEVWITIPQDPGQSGKDQLEGYRTLLSGYTVLSRTITKNKVVMAANGPESAAALWQRGQIEIVRGNWNKDLLDELDAFPTPKIHDDQVDALSGAIHRLPGKAPPDYSKGGLGGRFRTVEAKNRYRK